jgi:hypothetical protein
MNKMIRPALALAVAATLAAPSAVAKERSKADLEMWRAAQRECNSWKWMPDGARIYINYKAGWFRCEFKRASGKHARK